MSEEIEALEAGAAGADPAALMMTLGVAEKNQRVAAEAEAFLKERTRLVRLQAWELAHEKGLTSPIRWKCGARR